MSYYLNQVIKLTEDHEVPVIIAGDIFDEYNPSPRLVNFAIDHFRKIRRGVYAVPGQHDLPFHNYDDMHKSGYGTLIKAGVVNNLGNTKTHPSGTYASVKGKAILHLVGFPWGYAMPEHIKQLFKNDPSRNFINIAVVHRYLWRDEESRFPGASEEDRIGRAAVPFRKAGFDHMIIGDNHKRWSEHFATAKLDSGYDGRRLGTVVDSIKVTNCGCFIRQKSNEIPYKPTLTLLYDDKTVSDHPLDTTIDNFVEQEDKQNQKIENNHISALVESLKGSIAVVDGFTKQLVEAVQSCSQTAQDRLAAILKEAEAHANS